MATIYLTPTNLGTTSLLTTVFVTTWFCINRHVKKFGPIPTARTVITFNSRVYAIFSLLLAIAISRCLYQGQEGTELQQKCAYIYHLSKFYEYIDVLLLQAQNISIGKHMAFHHLTTPFLTYFRVLHADEWELFAFLNCIHHALMYSYFGGVVVLRPLLYYTGYLQLVAGIVLDVLYFLRRSKWSEEDIGRAVGLLLLLRYAQLFREELRTGSQQKSQRGDGHDEGKVKERESGEKKEEKHA